MPIEIRELVVKTSVSGGGQANSESSSGARASPKDTAAIVTECVDQVLAILKDKADR